MTSWQKHAALLDMQPSSRRLVQQSRTPRTLREAGLTPMPEYHRAGIEFDSWIFGVSCGASPWLLVLLVNKIWS